MKKLIKKILSPHMRRGILEFFNRIWVFFCSHLPMHKRVLFYTIRSQDKLVDNSKVIYDSLDCKKVIYANVLPHSIPKKLKAYRLILTSKVIVTDDYCRYMQALKLRKGQELLQVWHGCGAFKKIALDVKTQRTKKDERAVHAQYSAVCVTSEGCKKFYAGAFGIDESRCLPIGSPRTDAIINNPDELRNRILSKRSELKDKTVYLYCPTFRETNAREKKYDPNIDWDSLSKSLSPEEMIVVCRHPAMNYEILDKKYPNIIDMTEESTLELTSIASVMVTDYSSVIYEAVLLDVPCVFYCPDAKKFERSFYLDFPYDLPGDLVENPDDILDCIRLAKQKPPFMKINDFREKQLSACDGHSTERVVDLIKSWL